MMKPIRMPNNDEEERNPFKPKADERIFLLLWLCPLHLPTPANMQLPHSWNIVMSERRPTKNRRFATRVSFVSTAVGGYSGYLIKSARNSQ